MKSLRLRRLQSISNGKLNAVVASGPFNLNKQSCLRAKSGLCACGHFITGFMDPVSESNIPMQEQVARSEKSNVNEVKVTSRRQRHDHPFEEKGSDAGTHSAKQRKREISQTAATGFMTLMQDTAKETGKYIGLHGSSVSGHAFVDILTDHSIIEAGNLSGSGLQTAAPSFYRRPAAHSGGHHNLPTFHAPAFGFQKGAILNPAQHSLLLQQHVMAPLGSSVSQSGIINQARRLMSSSATSLPQQKPATEEERVKGIQHSSQAGSSNLPRCWEITESGRQQVVSPQPGLEFHVMTYNVLAQDLLESHRNLYTNCPSFAVEWSYRQKHLLCEIKDHSPDVVCLQEVESEHYQNFFLPELQAIGYDGVYKKRTGDKCDGCAIFYKKSKFILEKATPIDYCRNGLMDRDNIALIVELKPKAEVYKGSVPKVCVATTHLLFNPRRGDIKLGQLMMMMAELDKCARAPTLSGSNPMDPKYYPIILCGDFNLEPYSSLYKLIVRGYLRYEGLLSRSLSGQREGWQGRDVYLQRDFFSPTYGITDQCQYVSSQVSTSQTVPKLYQDMAVTNPENSFSNFSHQHAPSSSFNTGFLWHRLNLVSVYKHRIERLGHSEREVTTQHNGAECTVDYIFYNVTYKDSRTRRDKLLTYNIKEGPLVLLARYGLMSTRELDHLGGLPNPDLSSDHLCLIAKFLLKH